MTTQIEPAARLLHSVREAAVLLDVSPNTVWNLLASSELRGVKIGRSRKITAAELARYVKRLEAAEEAEDGGAVA